MNKTSCFETYDNDNDNDNEDEDEKAIELNEIATDTTSVVSVRKIKHRGRYNVSFKEAKFDEKKPIANDNFEFDKKLDKIQLKLKKYEKKLLLKLDNLEKACEKNDECKDNNNKNSKNNNSSNNNNHTRKELDCCALK